MSNRELREPVIIDLGKASFETRGAAIFEDDGSGSQLRYVTGSAED